MPIGKTDPSLVAHQPLGDCVNLFLGQIELKVAVVVDYTGWKMASSAMPADPLMISDGQKDRIRHFYQSPKDEQLQIPS